MFEKLLENPALRKVALSGLTKNMKATGVKLGTFVLDNEGEIDVQFHTTDMVVITAAEYKLLTDTYTGYLLSLQTPQKACNCRVKSEVQNG